MEINAQRRQMMIAAPTAKTENAPAIQAITPVQAVAITTQQAASAGELHAKLQKMPEIDSERVATAKADIQAGKIKLNTADIAQAMLNFHRS
ncbi:flagellar biosynthesis anti-sigma factor FlgM [Yersinia enterocolitica]|uniref:flagellar biosynthesis anti-sigma factor FlgM n=1 Tax=Yersinia TaxID=629 RepID=UPI00227D1979|nr:flagellar biosynthesis anti-sigma factor FlgM [Yersinia enterocolitica]MCY1688853.1 flagellar biosynthesis anti-sigma factor FlgM [Yersinia enterocolitica]HDL7014479.1 flagellar biosynthesis anti-sigma factor FlgM [Yersinia enterocolitica]HDL7086331.1 flagellar biosynthesis anti-sigma factor FlgM [Yersinia enterocolitica]